MLPMKREGSRLHAGNYQLLGMMVREEVKAWRAGHQEQMQVQPFNDCSIQMSLEATAYAIVAVHEDQV